MSSNVPTITEQKFLALAPKLPTVISAIMSSSVICSFCRNARKRKRLYHRLAFVMSCYGILFSLGLCMGTSLFPSDTSDTYGALGNKTTCTFQGILAQLTLAVPLYYASLAVYCYVAINANFKDEHIVWIEPWIHGTIHVFTVLSSIFIAVTDNINPSGTVCWIATAPHMCGPDTDIPCKRGDPKKVRLYSLLMSVIPVYGMIIVSGIMMVKVYISQKNMDIKNYRGKQEILHEAKKKKTKIIALQGSLYFAAFVVSYGVPLIHRSMILFTAKSNYIIFTVGVVLVALQNTFFTLVYFGLQNKPTSSQPVGEEMSYCANLTKRLSGLGIKPELENGHSEETVEDGDGPKRRSSFSIFDGSSISDSPWGQFLIDDILEEDENELSPDQRPA